VTRILERFLPAVELTNCVTQVASHNVLIPHAVWHDERLVARLKPPAMPGVIELAARITESPSLQFQATWKEADASVRAEFHKLAAGWRLNGEAIWRTNRADLAAQFATDGWWPVTARLNCPELRVPGSVFQLSGYQDLGAALAVNVSSNQFSLQATGLARPTEDFAAKGLPALDFSLAADGDPKAVHLRKLHIQSPSLEAELTNSMGMTWNGELLEAPAQLQVALDLGQLPSAALTGQVKGVVCVRPQTLRSSSAQFELTADGIHLWRAGAADVLVKGKFVSPKLQLDQLAAELADGSKLTVRGAFDFNTRQIAGGEWKCSGGFLKALAPGLSCSAWSGSGQVRGPLTNLTQRGEVTIKGLQAPQLKPLDAEAKWSGHNLRLESAAVELAGGESILSIVGGADLSGLRQRKASATLTNILLRRSGETLYALQHPCAISFEQSGTNAPSRLWTLAVDSFAWRGANRSASVTAELSWPASGNVTTALANVALADFSDFLKTDLSNLSLSKLAAAAHWSNGPVHAIISVAAATTNRLGERFALSSALATGETLSLKQFSVENRYTPTLSVTGSLPCELIPGRAEGWLVWDESAAIAMAGTWEDSQAQRLSLPLGRRGELEVSKPKLRLLVSGTPENPSAALKVAAATTAWRTSTNQSPRLKLEDLHFDLEIVPHEIKLAGFGAQLDGQPIQASGDWPLPPGTWRALWSERKWPDWAQAQGRARVNDAQMAALARYLPQVLAAEGQLNAELELKAGKQLAGFLSLTNVATRAIGKLTPMREIAAQVRLEGDRAVLEQFGGQDRRPADSRGGFRGPATPGRAGVSGPSPRDERSLGPQPGADVAGRFRSAPSRGQQPAAGPVRWGEAARRVVR
jgi:hypothetical protein